MPRPTQEIYDDFQSFQSAVIAHEAKKVEDMSNPIIRKAELKRSDDINDKAFALIEQICREIIGSCDYKELRRLGNDGADLLLERANGLAGRDSD